MNVRMLCLQTGILILHRSENQTSEPKCRTSVLEAQICDYDFPSYLSRARMGLETDIVEPVLAGHRLSEMFVQEICPGMHPIELILM